MDLDDKYGPARSQMILERYILDYMRRRKLTTAADIFANEAEIVEDPVALNGLLSDWWAVFYDTYISSLQYKPEEHTTSPIDRQTQTHVIHRPTPRRFQTSVFDLPLEDFTTFPFISPQEASMIPRPSVNIFKGSSPQTAAGTSHVSPIEIYSNPESNLPEREVSTRVLTCILIGLVVVDLVVDFFF